MNGDSAAALLAICRQHVDPAAQPLRLHRSHRTTVLLVQTRRGHVIVKGHRHEDRHRQELHAYRHWTTALNAHAPALLAANLSPPAIIITAAPGDPLDTVQLSERGERDAHHHAGRLLQVLHQAAPAQLNLNMAAWLSERADQWLAVARNDVAAATRNTIRAHMRDLSDLEPLPAAPCHLDYIPRNLLYDRSGHLTVIDYEHSRYDLPARDLVRLATRIWPQRPDLAAAFLDGYGPLSDADRQVITHCAHLDQLTATARAAGHRLSSPGPRPDAAAIRDGEALADAPSMLSDVSTNG